MPKKKLLLDPDLVESEENPLLQKTRRIAREDIRIRIETKTIDEIERIHVLKMQIH